MSLSISSAIQNQAAVNQPQKISQNQDEMPIKSMTYNLRIQEADQGRKDTPYYWKNREQAILDMVSGKDTNNGQKLDFVALQECGTTYKGGPTWIETMNEAMKPGGKLDGYGAIEHGDNVILYRKDKWQVGKTQIFNVGSNEVIGSQFTHKDHPEQGMINIFGGHLPHAGAAPKSLQGLANDIHNFEEPEVKHPNEHWADNHRTIFMMDSNDKEKVDGDPSYDHDRAFDWAGFQDMFHEKHPEEKTAYTNNAWGIKGPPSLREDLQFVSGFDTDAENNSEIIHHKFEYNGQMYNPSDHLAVVNTTYFKGLSNSNVSPSKPSIEKLVEFLQKELQKILKGLELFQSSVTQVQA